jgi:hypothetical protein
LGEVALMNNQWAQAEEQFWKGYDFACAIPLRWNDRLSFLWSLAIALENDEKPQPAIDIVNQCVALADAELAANPSPEDTQNLLDFKRSFEEKLALLAEDAREQEANKDVLKAEREEEEVDEEEEEEEEAAEEPPDHGNPPDGPDPTKE